MNHIDESRHFEQMINDDAAFEHALALAARDAFLEHKQAGRPIVVWENDKLVWIPAEEIQVDPTIDSSQ